MAKEEKKVEIITVVYKTYLHCPKCAQDIQKPLLRIPGEFGCGRKLVAVDIYDMFDMLNPNFTGRVKPWADPPLHSCSTT